MIERPEELSVSMITLSREPQYVHKTLVSLYAADPWVKRLDRVSVFIGSPDDMYVNRYRQHSHLDIHPMTAKGWREIEPLTLGQRLCFNMRRALKVADSARGVLVLEDDVVFKDGFLQKLIETIREIETTIGHTRYILAGYYSYDFRIFPDLHRGDLFTAYPCDDFYGSQCLYYPREVVAPLRDYITRFGFGDEHMPVDMVIKRLGADLRDRHDDTDGIYACARALAQHIGDVTSGVGSFHQSPTF
jgi:hypothetical protein